MIQITEIVQPSHPILAAPTCSKIANATEPFWLGLASGIPGGVGAGVSKPSPIRHAPLAATAPFPGPETQSTMSKCG
jgi:hypothetical protein